MGAMSPNSPPMEQEGMNEARDFFAARLEMSSRMVRFFGDQVFQKRQAKQDALLNAKGVGFRRMAYIIAVQRMGRSRYSKADRPQSRHTRSGTT